MTRLDCREVRAMASELALGVVSGRERADGVAHLAGCRACRQVVDDLAGTVDSLLLIGPQAEPSLGFETALAERLRAEVPAAGRKSSIRTRQPKGRLRRFGPWVAAAAALLLVAAAVALGVGSVDGGSRAGTDQPRTAVMSTPDGRTVGRVVLTDHPSAVFIALPTWRLVDEGGQGPGYRLRVRFSGDRTADLGPVELGQPHATWGTVTTFDARSVRSVTLVDEDGRPLCSATLRA